MKAKYKMSINLMNTTTENDSNTTKEERRPFPKVCSFPINDKNLVTTFDQDPNFFSSDSYQSIPLVIANKESLKIEPYPAASSQSSSDIYNHTSD